MKKHLLLTIFLLLNLHANSDTQNQSINDLREELEKLKSEIATLKNTQNENSEAIDEISDASDRIEANSLKDKITFSLGFKTYIDNFTKTYADGTDVKSNNVWSNKLMLNMKADITDNMNFYGRLSMYKYWGSSNIHPFTYYDNMQGRVPASSNMYVERAYVNWFFKKNSSMPMALTIGRQPSSDGPSNQFKDNTSRKGTYSALLYDGAADGIVFTANLSKLIKLPKSYLRVGYSKGYGYTETSSDVSNAFIGASNNDIKDTNVAGLFFDTSLPNVKNSLIQLSYSRMFDIVANPLDNNTSSNITVGELDLYGAMFESTNFKDTNLDFFIQYGYSRAHPNGNSYATYGGLLSADGDTSDKSGYSTWVGTRYGFGDKAHYKLGLEYNYGSKNWINLTQGSFDIYNKLATRGNAYESYFMYVINRYSNLRLGYIYVDYKYTGSGWFVGESKKITSSMPYSEYTLKKLESIYIKMNINF